MILNCVYVRVSEQKVLYKKHICVPIKTKLRLLQTPFLADNYNLFNIYYFLKQFRAICCTFSNLSKRLKQWCTKQQSFVLCKKVKSN